MNAVTDVKGWCPGIIRPMASGDGLIVRVRPRCGAFSLGTAAVLADVAERLGNGHIDLRRSVPDVLASTANLLKVNGWQSGAPCSATFDAMLTTLRL